jgi:hypothetical protein
MLEHWTRGPLGVPPGPPSVLAKLGHCIGMSTSGMFHDATSFDGDISCWGHHAADVVSFDSDYKSRLLERKANDLHFQARAQKNRNLLRLSLRFREVFVCVMETVLLVSALARAPYCLYSWLCLHIVTVVRGVVNCSNN